MTEGNGTSKLRKSVSKPFYLCGKKKKKLFNFFFTLRKMKHTKKKFPIGISCWVHKKVSINSRWSFKMFNNCFTNLNLIFYLPVMVGLVWNFSQRLPMITKAATAPIATKLNHINFSENDRPSSAMYRIPWSVELSKNSFVWYLTLVFNKLAFSFTFLIVLSLFIILCHPSNVASN